MKRITILLVAVFMATTALTQDYNMPEIVEEKLNQENIDQAAKTDYEEPNLSEENYYQYIDRDKGTDTIIGYKWNRNGQQWIMRERIIKTYNEFEQVTEKLFQYLTAEGSWMNGLHFSFSYHPNGKPAEKTIQFWHKENNEWINRYHQVNEINNLNQLVSIVTQRWAKDSATWVNRHQRLFSYAGDTLKSDTVFAWRFSNNLWTYKQLNHYHHDSTGKLYQKVQAHWFPNEEVWIPVSRNILHYIADSKLKIVLHQGKRPNTHWINKDRHIFDYDSYGNRTQRLHQVWMLKHNKWSGVELREMTYENGFLKTATIKAKKPWNWAWNNIKHIAIERDNNGNITEKLTQRWNKQWNEWENAFLWQMDLDYKQGDPGMPSNNKDTTFPEVDLSFTNPYQKGSPIHVSGMDENHYEVAIYNTQGKQVYTKTIESGSSFFLPNNLPKGLYVVTIANNNQLLESNKIIISE